jgi:hypothetical protein
MNYKTIIICALLAGSMQHARGMDRSCPPNDNNNNKEVSNDARLATALEMNKKMETLIQNELLAEAIMINKMVKAHNELKEQS